MGLLPIGVIVALAAWLLSNKTKFLAGSKWFNSWGKSRALTAGTSTGTIATTESIATTGSVATTGMVTRTKSSKFARRGVSSQFFKTLKRNTNIFLRN